MKRSEKQERKEIYISALRVDSAEISVEKILNEFGIITQYGLNASSGIRTFHTGVNTKSKTTRSA